MNNLSINEVDKQRTPPSWIPFMVLGLSISLTLAVTYYLHVSTNARDQLRFQNVAQRTEIVIQNRLEMYIAILRATAALFDASEAVTREEFQSFISRIDVQKNYQGIQGVGFSLRIKPEEKETYVAVMRKLYWENFNIRPEQERPEYHSITYLEPQDRRNQVAIGYDMFTEATRHAAMERARDSGLPAMSGKVTLVQEIDKKKQAGFLIYVPIYRHGMPRTSVAERQAALYGFAYSPFRTGDLMHGILGGPSTQNIDFKIFAGTEPKGGILLYQSDEEMEQPTSAKARFTTTRKIDVAGFPWTIIYNTRSEFDVASNQSHVIFTLLAGIFVSIVLFLLALSQAKARRAAELLAKQVQETERLKSQFLANVSHELRTPLTLTLAPLESLLAGDYNAVPENQRGILQTIHNNAVRLLQMVTGLLDFSKLEAGKLEVKREPTPIAGLTRMILTDFGSLAKQRRLTFQEDLAAETIIDMDRYLYERILFNLVSNAIKFTPEGGKISVMLKWHAGRLQLAVADTGQGIPESELPYLFQRFRQVEGSSTRRFEGTGLGLALVKEFSNLLGGEVSVESSLGKGSRFTVDLAAPETGAKAEDLESTRSKTKIQKYELQAPSPQVSEKFQKSSLPKVLIAEDNIELATYISSLLKDIAQVQIVWDGEEALETLRKWSPDAVLSDVMMPKRDGFSLCREIKSNPETTKISVVLLTALTHRDALLKGWEAGADEYLFKPFHPKELITRMKSILSNMQMAKQVQEITIQAQKMGAVGQLAAGVAHEINNPLGIILGFAQHLSKQIQKGDPLSMPIQSIERETIRCKELVQQLLVFSRKAKDEHKEEIDLNDTINHALTLVEIQTKTHNVELIKDFTSALPRMMANKTHIQQIVINLANNSIDAMPKGGKLTIQTRKVRAGGKDYAQIDLEDTGQGMPPEIQKRIFEPFFTTKGVGKGTGLGLSLVYEIVQKNGGKITLESAVGRGTVFHIRWPLQP